MRVVERSQEVHRHSGQPRREFCWHASFASKVSWKNIQCLNYILSVARLSPSVHYLLGLRSSGIALTFVAARPVLVGVPSWIFQLIAVEHIFRNNWMHMNVFWKSAWLE